MSLSRPFERRGRLHSGQKISGRARKLSRLSSVYGSDYHAALKEPAYSVSKTSFTSSH